MPHPLWIVVANGSRARVLQRLQHNQPLTELKDWVHPATRQHRQDMVGHHRQSGIQGRSGLAERQAFQDQERAAFAGEICQWLLDALNQRQVDRIALLSSNPFLGELVAHGQGALQRHLHATHPVDLTRLPLDELDTRLRQSYRL